MNNPFLMNRTSEQHREWSARGGRAMTDKKRACLEKLAFLNTGKRKPAGKSEAGTGHWKSKFWVLVSPDRRLVCGVNLNEIVRRNSHLFPAKYLKKEGSHTKAAHRLRMLFYVHNKKGLRGRSPYVLTSWNGWMAADSAEMVKNVVPRGYAVQLRPKIQAQNEQSP